MNCEQARQLMDERLHAAAGGGGGDWSALEAHLAVCPRCAAEWAELRKTREMLAGLPVDQPTAEEVETMWMAIEGALPAGAMAIEGPSKAWVLRRFAAAGLGVAACLMIAFFLGQERYGLARARKAVRSDSGLAYRSDDAAAVTDGAAAGYPVQAAGGAGVAGQEKFVNKDGQWAYGFADADGDGAKGIMKVGEQVALRSPAYTAGAAETAGGTYGKYEAGEGEIAGRQIRRGVVVAQAGDEVREGAVVQNQGVERVSQSTASAEEAVRGMSKRAGAFLSGTDFKETSAPPAGQTPAPTNAAGGVVLGGAPAAGGQGGSQSTNERYGDVTAYFNNTDATTVKPIVKDVEGFPSGLAYGLDAAGHAEFKRSEGGSMNGVALDEAEPSQGTPAKQPAGADVKPSAAATPPPVVAKTKTIKTGQLGIAVDEYRAAVEVVNGIVGRFNAFVADTGTQEGTGGALSGRIVIRVAPEQFEDLFAALKAVGRVESESAKALDVTADYVDLEARINSLQLAEAQLAEMLKSKSVLDKLASVLEVQREMNRVRTEIEQLQGQMRVMNDRIAWSTITVTMHEPARTVPSASLSVEVPVLEQAAAKLGEAVAGLGGRMTSGKTTKRPDGTLVGNYEVEVSLARFPEMLAAVDTLGRIEERQIKDQQADAAAAPWASKVQCKAALVLYERSRQLPSGRVELEVEELSAALEKLSPVLAGATASIVSNQTARRDDGSSVATLQVKAPAGKFAALIEGLAPLGRMTAKQVAGEAGQIVGGAANVLCDATIVLAERPRQVPSGTMSVEVTDFENARTQLSAIIKDKGVQILQSGSTQRVDGSRVGGFKLGIKGGDMEAVVEKLEKLGRVTGREITGLGLGDLSRMDPGALGVIGLTIGEKANINPDPARTGGAVRRYLSDGLAGLYASVGLILYGLVVMAPWLVVVLVVAWVIVRSWKRRAAAKGK